MPGSAVVDIRGSFGAAFAGLLVSTALLGVTIVQAWIYYWRYRDKDRKPLKILVAFLVIMETLHTCICAYMVYWYLVLNFGNVRNLRYSMWASNVQVLISSLAVTAVQLYYARRFYIVSGSMIIPIIIVVFVAGGDSITFFLTAKHFAIKQLTSVHYSLLFTGIVMGVFVLVDALIAGAMCWALYRKKTGFARTDSMIMTLMAYTINSGVLTSLLGTAMTISYVTAPHTLIWLAFFWAMGKCHVMLAMLNSRNHVRELSSTDNRDNAYNLSSIRIEPPSGTFLPKSKNNGISVTVHHSTASDSEPTFEVSKPETSMIPSQSSQSRTSESSAVGPY